MFEKFDSNYLLFFFPKTSPIKDLNYDKYDVSSCNNTVYSELCVRVELSRGCARGLQGARKNNKPHITNLTPRGVASHWLSFWFDSTRLDSAWFDWPRLASPCLPHHTLSRFVSCRLVSSRIVSCRLVRSVRCGTSHRATVKRARRHAFGYARPEADSIRSDSPRFWLQFRLRFAFHSFQSQFYLLAYFILSV